MSYQALYRQRRPHIFEDVVGQEHVTKTLKNAVQNDYIAHAYLFAGPRGVGKTSTARILARAVNCPNLKNANPCDQCTVCQSILEGRAFDVIEIDAASNNGVDEIRDLREKVKYSPVECKYKVYIIDEVHMLSTAAFNALLKTLEEPPSHVIFILATTEAHKIPATIISRCQRFDFHRIKQGDIVNHLCKIANDLDFKVAKEAANLIARAADGALRDAISILDQCLAYSENEITLDAVMDLLGAVGDIVFYNLTECIVNGDMIKALNEIEQIYHKGHSLEQFLIDYLHYLRSLLTLSAGINERNIILIDLELAHQQVQSLGNERLFMIIHSIVKAVNEIKYAQNQRLVVELAILESQYMTGNDFNQLSARISILEHQVRSGSVHIEPEIAHESSKYNSLADQLIEDNNTVIDNVVTEEVSEDLPQGEDNSLSIALIERNWKEILKKVKEEDVITEALLKGAHPKALENNRLILEFETSFHCEQVTGEPKRSIITGVFQDLFNATIDVVGEVVSSSTKKKAPKVVEEPQVNIVQKAIDIFDGKIVSDLRKEGS